MRKSQIHARLIERHSNFRQFALTHGYDPRLVLASVDRWVPRGKLPRGRTTYKILRDLSREIGREVIPGILQIDE